MKLKETLALLRRKYVYTIALNYIGTDPTPGDQVDDVVACAHSVTTILMKAGMMDRIIIGTWTLEQYFKNSPHWTPTDTPGVGDVILSATGTGNGKIRGHVGLCGKNGIIMSNDSWTGKWMANYTEHTWKKRYKSVGGFPITYWRYA